MATGNRCVLSGRLRPKDEYIEVGAFPHDADILRAWRLAHRARP